jgi:outer membrane protein assembly factor BamB
LWQIQLEEGYAGAAVRDGCVYVLDYDVEAQADTMRCLSLADGREIWRNSYPVTITPNHGITRTVPALAGDCVLSIGPRCHVACWDAQTGDCHWLQDMVRKYGAEERPWYTGQCPLVDGDRLILAPCGPDALLIALDYRTGDIVWRTPNPRGWKMTHSSIMPMEFAGRRIYVYCGTGGTAGVSADDGTLLWDETSWAERFATSPSPLPLPDGRILLSSGYDMTGAMMLQMKETGDSLEVETAFTLKRKQFNSEQQTPIFYNGHLYGVRKVRGRMLCLDLEGNEIWNSGDLKFGHGPYMVADGLLIALADKGLLVCMEATAEGFRPLAQFQVFQDGIEAWGLMALVDGRLIVRDLRRMACLDIRDTAAGRR